MQASPMSPVYPQMLEQQIQQLSVNGDRPPRLPPPPPTTNGISPVLGPPGNRYCGVDNFTTRYARLPCAGSLVDHPALIILGI